MKRYLPIILVVLLSIITSSCTLIESVFGPTPSPSPASSSSPSPSTSPSPSPKASFVIDGVLTYDYTSYSAPRINGIVKNIGNAIGYNLGVYFTAYKNNVIVDTAKAFPASLGDIPVGISATFSAVFFNLTSHSDYDRTETKFDFLSR